MVLNLNLGIKQISLPQRHPKCLFTFTWSIRTLASALVDLWWPPYVYLTALKNKDGTRHLCSPSWVVLALGEQRENMPKRLPCQQDSGGQLKSQERGTTSWQGYIFSKCYSLCSDHSTVNLSSPDSCFHTKPTLF